MSKIVIIASLSQKDEIKKVADKYKKLGYIVDYPTEQPNKPFSRVVEDYLYRISLADSIVAITKPEGTFGIGATYELAFARFLNKPISVIKHCSNYEKCKGCPYYYGEIDNCMFGEEDVPDNLEQKCKKEN